MKTVLVCTGLVLLSALPLPAASPSPAPATEKSGRDPSFAFVSLDALFKGLPQTKEASAKVEEASKAALKEYESRQAELKKLTDKTAVAEKQAEILLWQQARAAEIQQQGTALRETILRDVNGAVNRLAQNIGLVFDFSGLSVSGVPFVVLHPSEAEITTRLASALEGKDAGNVNSVRGLRVGTIDLNGVFTQLRQTKTAEEKLKNAQESARTENEKLTSALKAERARIADLAETARAAQEAKAQKLEEELAQFRTAKEKEIGQAMLEARQPIVQEMARTLEKIAGDRVSLLFDRTGQGMSTVPFLVFSQGLPDFTSDLVAAVNGETATKGTATTGVLSSELRFGLVDIERLYKESANGKKAEAEIQETTKNAVAEMAALSPLERGEKQAQISNLLQHKRQPIIQEIIAVVGEVARAGSFNAVLDTSGRTTSMTPVVLNVHDIPDLTAAVAGKLPKAAK